MRVVAAVLAISLGLGCKVTATFTCSESPQCGVGGTCEPNGLCAFPDATCLSGSRYGDYSGDLSGVCVGEEPSVDAPIDEPDGACAAGWQPTYFDACLLPMVTTELRLPAGNFVLDTDTGMLTPPDEVVASVVIDQRAGGQARVVVTGALNIEPGALITVTGSLPLIIASWGDAVIEGAIDGGSHAASSGPGAVPDLCPGGAGVIGVLSGGSGGGGGGGFQGAGGDGGRADDPNNIAGGPGGGLVAMPASVRAGCAGGTSGAAGPGANPPATPATTALGGAGGGGFAIAANGTIVLGAGAVLRAGGAGGAPNPAGSGCGGGGGGSGGFIGLDSRSSISVDGRLAANGGGGGAGGSFSLNGMAGADGGTSSQGAAGGTAPMCGGPGGLGAAGDVPDGGDATVYLTCGGGGGGGGTGWTVIHTPVLVEAPTVLYSPPRVHIAQ